MDKLLKLLEENALLSAAVLAKRLGKSEAEIKKHIKRLEEEKVILAYKAIIDDEKARRSHVRAVVEVKLTPERGGGFNRLAARIARYPEVRSCFLMSGGAYDLLVFVEAKTLRDVAHFVSERLATIQGVNSTATRFSLKTYKDQNVLMVGEDDPDRLQVAP
jgi:DNA-binding Lrp family transcriptional regulator